MQHNKHHRIRIIQALNHALNCNLSGSNRLQMKRNLHQAHSFKASEVPSAIFGTKRRPIENGIIPDVEHDKRDDESRNNDKQQTEVKRDTQQPVQSTQAENTNQQSQHNDETTHRDDIIKTPTRTK